MCFQLVKVFGEDSHSRCLWVSAGATAREVCDILVQTAHCSDQKNWALIELHQALGLGKMGPYTHECAPISVQDLNCKELEI